MSSIAIAKTIQHFSINRLSKPKTQDLENQINLKFTHYLQEISPLRNHLHWLVLKLKFLGHMLKNSSPSSIPIALNPEQKYWIIHLIIASTVPCTWSSYIISFCSQLVLSNFLQFHSFLTHHFVLVCHAEIFLE